MRLGDLQGWYGSHSAFKKLKPNSQRNYKIWLKTAINILGAQTLIEDINWEVADRVFSTVEKQVSTHKAVSVIRTLSAIWGLLLRRHLVNENPFIHMRLPSLPSRTQMWSMGQVMAFSEACIELGHRPLGIMAEACYVLCQRPIDIRLMKKHYLDQDILTFSQVKTGTHMSMWVTPTLLNKLYSLFPDDPSLEGYVFINPDTKKHYTARDYNVVAFDAKRRAKIPITLQLRDLRRTGLTEAADKGATDSELLSLGGHTKIDSLKPYRLRTAQQTENATKKRFGLVEPPSKTKH